jgi:hypothetical protein
LSPASTGEAIVTIRTVTAKDPKPTPERIEQLAQRVLMGDIVLPEFQRPFVWKRKQIIELVDSIFRNYPIGSMLVWESTQELASKRTIADLEVGERSKSYPVNYLLDGQQRLSTICGVLYWAPGDPKSYWNVAFDLKSQKFFHADHVEELPLHQIPLRRLADPADYFRRGHECPLRTRWTRSSGPELFSLGTERAHEATLGGARTESSLGVGAGMDFCY